MKYLDLFAGIGGFTLGIQQAYESLCNQKERGQGKTESISKRNNGSISKQSNVRQSPDCVGYSEIDKYAIQIYESHFKHKNFGDITKINAKELPDFDLLVGGFPCQSFSIAGKRGGFSDTRGTLFFDIARIVREKQPRLLLLENVKGLLSHDKGATFYTIISTLDELGYDIQWQVLNSKDFGVPQNRERVFIVGHLRGTPRPKVFPITETSGKDNVSSKREADRFVLKEVRTEKGKVSRKEIRKKEGRDSTARGKDDKKYIPNKNGLANCITTAQADVEKYLVTPQTSYAIDANYYKGTNLKQYHKKKRRQLVANPQIRRLTPTECERLQGFPDGWTEGVSDTQRYKTLGNAVTINVIQEIVKRLLND